MIKRVSLFAILFIQVVGSQATSKSVQLSFQHFPYVDQLPSNSINRLYNDREGYMWFGTKDGLCRFDGYTVKVFRSSSTNQNRLTNNSIQYIAEDDNNRLWVGTLEGVNIIDKSNYSIKPLENRYVGRDRINSIFKDKSGCMWIATNSNGLVRIFANGKSICFSNTQAGGYSLPCNNIRSVYQDSKGRIWVMMLNKGIALFQGKTSRFLILPPIGTTNNPFRMIEDSPNHFLICTWGDGLYSMDVTALPRNPFTPITVLKNGKPTTISNITYSIVRDNKVGYVWVVSFTGLIVLEKKNNTTYNLINSESMFPEPYYKLFHEIVRDRQGNLWLGTVGEGIFSLNFNNTSLQTNSLTKLKEKVGFPPIVVGFCESVNGFIYIVLNRLGLYLLNPKTGDVVSPVQSSIRNIQSVSAIKRIKSTHEIWLSREGKRDIYIMSDRVGESNEIKILPIAGNNEFTISDFCEDSQGNVWIGTDNGLYQRPAGSNKVILISPNINNITVIREDKKGNIWIGSDKQGVIKLQKLGGSKPYSTMINFSKKIGNLQSNSIQSICCRKNGDVCIGTRVGSIYFYDEKSNSMQDVSKIYGITEESVLEILEDDMGTLWISTIKKIIRFNPANHVTTYYTQSDGILVSSFAKDASIKLENGTMMFGGNKGFCVFSPNVLNFKPTNEQRVVITDIEVKNQSIFDNETDKYFNADKKQLTLQSNDNDVSLEFSTLNFTSADKIQYAYKLNGINKDWVYVGNNRRFVNYTNLPSGKYVFEIKATDENGRWSNKITSITIIKHSPFYQTWWAYFIYMLVIGLSAYFISKNIANRIRLRNELKISHIEKEKSEELTQIKLRYFTNISHELLTPLTIIMLLIERMQKKNASESVQFEIMKDNINRLKRLIQQILVFRKTESGNMKLKILPNDIVGFVNNICHSNFSPLINEKNIQFSIECEYESYLAYFDPDKLDKVIYNLLSNAFKHTPKGGTIQVKMKFETLMDDIYLCLTVSDTGDGIAEKDLPHIFKRFYISSNSDQSQSHGIGLALTYDLLQIHKGSVEVKSTPGEGATFSIQIPVSKAAYTDEELSVEESKKIELQKIPEVIDIEIDMEDTETIEVIQNGKDFTILVVEDNRELNNLIVDYFSSTYKVLSVENGIQALEIVHENEIDLIISDVMMPEMDGLTFCKIIKNDVSTSHINVLMLTAKNSTEDRIDCYNAGADAYIAKPFELAVLDARTKNLISKRRQKVEKFKMNKEINISSMEYGSLDELFLQQAVVKVEERLSDDTFDFDHFAINMSSSKSTLHRKLKSLTGLSPGEFIRNVRLKHAAQMLINNKGNISEIAFAVGFNDPKYFSRCFKLEFGVTPKEYQESKKN